jgi:probable selenium-dependent hydroxylase accessory protein YqeC
MSTPSERFREALARWFLPGAVYTFVGAGGKTTAMKRIAAFLAEAGVKARLTTTTRVGIDEFKDWAVTVVQGAADLARAFLDDAPVTLLVGGTARDHDRYLGIDLGLLEGIVLTARSVLLVEGDGSRKRPMKAPADHEPVIPSNSTTVFAVIGASAFDEPIDATHCYNHEKAAALAGKSVFEADAIAALAADAEGCRKGVLPGMAFRLLVNQGDIVEKRASASTALHLAHQGFGVRGALLSFQEEELYDATEE